MKIIKNALILLFVDSILIHTWWHCHRVRERSFSIDGRQFHICARCTGIVAGLMASPLFFPWGTSVLPWFILFSSVLCVDGITQFIGWRESKNTIRFGTGFLVAISGISVRRDSSRK